MITILVFAVCILAVVAFMRERSSGMSLREKATIVVIAFAPMVAAIVLA